MNTTATSWAAPSAAFDARVDAALALLREAAAEFPGRIVLANSMGVEDMVLTDLIARHALPVPLAMLDTGRLHAETLAMVERVRVRYGLDVEVWRPDAAAVDAFVSRHGLDPMYASVELRHACCAVRKLEPLARMLAGRDGWITGLRREQSAQRADMPARELDAQRRTKFNPLLEWSEGDVWHYVVQYDVPYNPLHDRHFPSIGCAPCTRAIARGEDFRAGRWWWEHGGDRECGLHAEHPTPTSTPIHRIPAGEPT